MKNEFYDMNLHLHPETSLHIQEAVSLLKKYGWKNGVATNHSSHDYKVDGLIQGVEIIAKDERELKEKISFFRPKVKVLSVHGGNPKINRAASRDKRVDFIAHPKEVDYITARFASENKIALDFQMGELIKYRGVRRSRIFEWMRENLLLARKYGTPILITSGASSIYEIRAPRELIALGILVGMGEEEAKNALGVTPQLILSRR